MNLPGKLTEKHIAEHKRQGNKFFFYKGQLLNTEKLLQQIPKEKQVKEKDKEDARSESRNKHKRIFDESEEN